MFEKINKWVENAKSKDQSLLNATEHLIAILIKFGEISNDSFWGSKEFPSKLNSAKVSDNHVCSKCNHTDIIKASDVPNILRMEKEFANGMAALRALYNEGVEYDKIEKRKGILVFTGLKERKKRWIIPAHVRAHFKKRVNDGCKCCCGKCLAGTKKNEVKNWFIDHTYSMEMNKYDDIYFRNNIANYGLFCLSCSSIDREEELMLKKYKELGNHIDDKICDDHFKDSVYSQNTKKRACSKCGKSGHNSRTCGQRMD